MEKLVERALAAARNLASQLSPAPSGDALLPIARMAPEFTGRTDDIADSRADLFALGTVMYEWATGRMPFEEGDPLRPLNFKLTQYARPPIELRSEIPQVLSDIILKLLETDSDRRYQSLSGLIHDLERCHQGMGQGRVSLFALGECDFQSEIPAPPTLFVMKGTYDISPRNASVVNDLDSLAILRASQVFSSERDILKLKSGVEELLRKITEATKVVLILWDEDALDWMIAGKRGTRYLGAGGASKELPLRAFRYAERFREPLILGNVMEDERFATDAYFEGVETCSLMVVPILHQGFMRAMLVLEKRASLGAFDSARSDAVLMIAGQLAASLESAQLYESLQRKVSEQTRELHDAQSRLLAEARRAGMAQIATNVLHNVGNVLTSVNVSTHVLAERVRTSRAARLADVAHLLQGNEEDVQRFLSEDKKGRLLPGYLKELAQALANEREELLGELERLGASVDHIKNVVAMQQSYAGASGVLEPVRLGELVDDALRIEEDALARHGVAVKREYQQVPRVALDKTRVMQVLVNLTENAIQAMEGRDQRQLTVSVRAEGSMLAVAMTDTGCGISEENTRKMFSHGFTTKPQGHGFGLHSCALAAREMGGSLEVHSGGPEMGATFTLRVPAPNTGAPGLLTSEMDGSGPIGAPPPT